MRNERTSFASNQDGSAAVEMGLVLPMLVSLLFGIFAFGDYAATLNGLEQLAAGAARQTVAGISDAERAQLAASYISRSVASYPYIIAASVQYSTSNNPSAKTCTVTITYDTTASPLLNMARNFFPIIPKTISRNAITPQGGT